MLVLVFALAERPRGLEEELVLASSLGARTYGRSGSSAMRAPPLVLAFRSRSLSLLERADEEEEEAALVVAGVPRMLALLLALRLPFTLPLAGSLALLVLLAEDLVPEAGPDDDEGLPTGSCQVTSPVSSFFQYGLCLRSEYISLQPLKACSGVESDEASETDRDRDREWEAVESSSE